jgi:hypothetical protein
MPIDAVRADNPSALTPYGLNRRKDSRDGRREERKKRENPATYLLRQVRRPLPSDSMKCSMDPSGADAALRKIEQGIQINPQAVQDSVSPHPETVQAALNGSIISRTQQ